MYTFQVHMNHWNNPQELSIDKTYIVSVVWEDCGGRDDRDGWGRGHAREVTLPPDLCEKAVTEATYKCVADDVARAHHSNCDVVWQEGILVWHHDITVIFTGLV